MSNDVKREFIYVTYKKYLDELNKNLPDKNKKWITLRNWLLIINIVMVSVLMVIGVFNIFNPLGEKFLYIYLGVEIVALIGGLYVALKVDKYIYSDEVYVYKFNAINKIIPKDRYNEMMKMLSIEESVSVYDYIKDFLIKVVGILSVGFGVIKPIIEQLLQPFLEKLVGLSESLTKTPLEQLFSVVGNMGIASILILISILLLWIGSVGLIKLYDRLIKLFHLTSYSKSCELLTICQLRTYYEKEEV